jgi:small-conductance mechanosensitive channel
MIADCWWRIFNPTWESDMFIQLLLAEATTAPIESDVQGRLDSNPTNILETLDNMWDGLLSRLPQIAIGLVLFIAVWFIAQFLGSLIRRSTRGRNSANLGKVLGRLARWTMVLVGLLIATSIIAPSVKPVDLLAGLGIGGVAIGFAFKDILQNFMSGVLILLREPFKVGDQIQSGEFEGTVEAIETRATFIKTYDGKRVVIPNSQIYTNPVVVNTAYENRRSQYDVGIGCSDDLREAAKIMLDVMQNTEGVFNDPGPDVLVLELAESSVNLRCRWWTAPDQASVMKVKDQVISKIKRALDAASIDMPYPTRVLQLHDQTNTAAKGKRQDEPANDEDPNRTLNRDEALSNGLA